MAKAKAITSKSKAKKNGFNLRDEIAQSLNAGSFDKLGKLFSQTSAISFYLSLMQADVNEEALLFSAVRNGFFETIKAYISLGKNINILDAEGNSPLLLALKLKRYAEAVLLISHGADVHVVNKKGEGALHFVSATDAEARNVVELLKMKGVWHTSLNKENKPAPLWSVGVRERKAFILAEADVDTFKQVCELVFSGDVLALEKVVNKIGLARFSTIINCCDVFFDTPLHMAIRQKNIQVINLLCKYGAEINIENDVGETALSLAVEEGLTDVAVALVLAGADVNVCDDRGVTPLYRAVLMHNQLLVDLLLAFGAKVNFALEEEGVNSYFGKSVLFAAVETDNLKMLQKFLELGAYTEVKTGTGVCVFGQAVRLGRLACVKELFEKTGLIYELNFDDDYYSMPMLAGLHGHLDVMRYLFENGFAPYIGAVGEKMDALENAVVSGIETGHSSAQKVWSLHKLETSSFSFYAKKYYLLAHPKYFIKKYGGDVDVFLKALQYDRFDVLQSLATKSNLERFMAQKFGSARVPLLHEVVFRGNIELANYLVELGAPLDEKDAEGNTLLHMMALKLDASMALEWLKKFEPETLKNLISAKNTAFRTPLHNAVLNKDPRMVDLLIAYGADVNAEDIFGTTPLQMAASYGAPEHIDSCVLNGANVLAENFFQESALINAVRQGDYEKIKRLVGLGARVSADILFQAVVSCNLKTFKLLVGEQLDLNQKNAFGQTLLSCAAKSSSVDVLEYLHHLGGDIHYIAPNGNTLLHEAVFSNSFACARYLINQGVGPNFLNHKGHTPLYYTLMDKDLFLSQFLISSGADINARDFEGDTLLHKLILAYENKLDEEIEGALFRDENSYLDCIQLLIRFGVDANKPDEQGVTPLYLTLFYDDKELQTVLEDAGGDLNYRIPNMHNAHFLHIAAQSGHDQVIQKLLSLGVNVDILDARSVTPLELASAGGYMSSVQLLIENGADVNHQDDSHLTPVYQALANAQTIVAKALIHAGAVFSSAVEPKSKRRLIHYAGLYGDLTALQTMLQMGVDVNTVDGDGFSPLHYACLGAQKEAIEFLVKHNARITLEDLDGRFPVDCIEDKTSLLYRRVLEMTYNALSRFKRNSFLKARKKYAIGFMTALKLKEQEQKSKKNSEKLMPKTPSTQRLVLETPPQQKALKFD